MTSRFIQETLNWTSLEKISTPISVFRMKTIATVLTQKGVGTVLCPKCNTLNIVRDSRFRCRCGFTSNITDCACSCGRQLLDKDTQGNPRKYIHSHNTKVRSIGRYIDSRGYVIVKHYDQHECHDSCVAQAQDGCWVREHALVIERKIGRRLQSGEEVHHINGDRTDNRSENLLLVTDGEHSRIHGKEHRSSVQICPRCYSYDTVKRGHNSYYRVRRGVHNITQRFLCRNCKRTFVHPIEEEVLS